MAVQGRVENGVVHLDFNPFPEGQAVSVTATTQAPQGTHSILDIPKFSVGKILDYHPEEEDILGEMLEGRKL